MRLLVIQRDHQSYRCSLCRRFHDDVDHRFWLHQDYGREPSYWTDTFAYRVHDNGRVVRLPDEEGLAALRRAT